MLTEKTLTDWWEAVESGNAKQIAMHVSEDTINLESHKFIDGWKNTSALMWCAQSARGDAVAVLLGQRGVDVNKKDSNWANALFYNLWNRDNEARYEITEMLLKAGCEVNTENQAGVSPLVLAAQHGQEDARILHLLLDHGAKDVDVAIEAASQLQRRECLNALQTWKGRHFLENGLGQTTTGKSPTL